MEANWAIVGAVLLPTVVIIGMLLEQRDRLTRVETKVNTMWKWMTRTNGNGEDH